MMMYMMDFLELGSKYMKDKEIAVEVGTGIESFSYLFADNYYYYCKLMSAMATLIYYYSYNIIYSEDGYD